MARVVAGGARVRLLWIVLVALSLVAAGLPAVADAASDSDATTNTSDYNRSPKHELPRVGQTYWLTSEWEPETSYLNRRGIDGMPANGIWLAELNETSQTWDSMRWRFEPAGKGFYRIANGFGPKTGYLTRKSRGGNTVTFTSHKKRSTRQLWRLESLGGDRIRISSGSRDKAHLHRHGIKQSDGSYLPSTDVRLSPKNENGSMIWRFRNVKDGLPVPMFELFAPSRVTTSALTETSMSLLWFPGVGGSGDLTYDVLVDGMPVVTGLTDVRHTLDGLDPKTQYSISVRAVDETGTAAASEIFEIGTQSTGRCADLVVTVELVRGEAPTDGDDVILGTEGDDVIDGLGGNDVICGLGGADNLSGGPGDDLVIGGDGLDVISGGPGDDLLVGQADADQLDGGEDNDEVFGGPGADQISGGAGDDQLYGEADADRIDGGVGADSLVGGGGGDTLIGGEGPDNIAGGPGNDTAHGGDESGAEEAGVDSIDGGPGDDVITGAADDDDLLGDVGDDNIDGGPGDDRIVGGPGNNTMVGGPGADLFVEPTGTFDQTSEDSVEQTYTATQTGGSFDTCPEGGFVDLIRGNRYECDWPFFLFAYAPDPVIAHEWGLDILFDCALDPIPGAGGELQCLRVEQFAGLPLGVEALTSNQTVQNYFRKAYATFRSWGMWRPFDAYFAFDIDDPEWPEVTTVVTFTDDASFRSRSVEPGLIEYGVTAGLTQREVTSDMFSQFIYRRILPDSAIYEANEATLDSLNEWVTGRIVNNDNPISCTLVTCSRRLAVDEGRGVLLWEYMLEETGGYGFIERLLTRLAAGNSTKAALNLELGLGWTRDFLAANEPTGSDSLDVGFSGLEATAFDLTWVNLARHRHTRS